MGKLRKGAVLLTLSMMFAALTALLAGAASAQTTPELWPTPRGSNPIRSKRRLRLANDLTLSCRYPVPDAPGPPGLIKTDPMRFAWSVAALRLR